MSAMIESSQGLVGGLGKGSGVGRSSLVGSRIQTPVTLPRFTLLSEYDDANPKQSS